MKLVLQPLESRVCGQACVAMLMDMELCDAIELVGKKGATRIKDLSKAIREKYECLDRLQKVNKLNLFPENAILRIRWDKKNSHWILKCGDTVYDPSFGQHNFRAYQMAMEGIGTITSYLQLTKIKK